MPEPDQTRATRWLKTFAIACVFLYLLPLALVRIPSFEEWGGSPFGPALDYPYALPRTDADIVLFGDSSALIGVDPRILSKSLSLKAINLPNTAGSLQVLGQSGLDLYLSRNKAPRLIVFYFAAWNLDYAHAPLGHHLYEGEEVLMHHGTLRQIVDFTRAHPLEMLDFSRRFYSTNLPRTIRTILKRQHPATDVAAGKGYFDPLLNRPPLPAPCTIPPELTHPVATDTIRNLLSSYRNAQTQVAFFVAPMPACTNIAEMTSRDYSQLSPTGLHCMPVADFKQDFAYVHLRPAAVPENTARLAALLAPILARK